MFIDLAAKEGEGWRAPSPFNFEEFGVTDPDLIAWNDRGNVLHPLKTMTDPISLQADPLPFPVSYIYCKEAAMGLFDQFIPISKAQGWDYHEVPLTHAGPAVAPEDSAELLLEIAKNATE
jgi:hypothetical protein